MGVSTKVKTGEKLRARHNGTIRKKKEKGKMPVEKNREKLRQKDVRKQWER